MTSLNPSGYKDYPCRYLMRCGLTIQFCKGKFDYWYVHVSHDGFEVGPQHDWAYFADFLTLVGGYGKEEMLEKFLWIYDEAQKGTTKIMVVRDVSHLSYSQFFDDQMLFERTMLILYYAMIAEENRLLPLGKRVKRLAIHQVVELEMDVDFVADFSRNEGAGQLMRLCENLGF